MGTAWGFQPGGIQGTGVEPMCGREKKKKKKKPLLGNAYAAQLTQVLAGGATAVRLRRLFRRRPPCPYAVRVGVPQTASAPPRARRVAARARRHVATRV